MKLNFWQWLGVILIVVAIIWWVVGRRGREVTPAPAPDPQTVPMTQSPPP
jgi:hypothetical protein